MGFPDGTGVNNPPPLQETQETWVWSLGQEDPQEEPPIPLFLPGKFHGQRSLAGYNPWVHLESDTSEQLSTSLKKCWALSQVHSEYSLVESSPPPMRNLWCSSHLTDEETEARGGPGDLTGITESIKHDGWTPKLWSLILRPGSQTDSSSDTRSLV